jgi:hypothetical protein
MRIIQDDYKELINQYKEQKMGTLDYKAVTTLPVGLEAAKLRQQMEELQAKLDSLPKSPADELKANLDKLSSKLTALENPPPKVTPGLKLDLGCGNAAAKKPGFIGVDMEQRDGVDLVVDLTKFPWPWADNSVEEVVCSHVVEHIPAIDHDFVLVKDPGTDLGVSVQRVTTYPRMAFFNELYRIMKPGAKAFIETPHWASTRAYGDQTHVWPPVSEMFFFYLNREWRENNTPHFDAKQRPEGAKGVFTCDFKSTWGYSLAGWMQGRNEEWKRDALDRFKEAAQDTLCTLVKQ